MSAPAPVVPIRIPVALIAEMGATISRHNASPVHTPWTRTDFVLIAIREKIAKMSRSRRSGRR